MRRLLSVAAAASLLVAQAPVLAEGTADDIGVMNVSLKDSIKPRFGFQGQTQGAGTPNEVGIGGFLPISVGDNSVLNVEGGARFSDANFCQVCREPDCAVMNICPGWITQRLPRGPEPEPQDLDRRR